MSCLIKNEKGIALFLVLWVLTLLSVIVGEFCFAMRTEVNITRNFKEQTEAYYVALAGLNTAISELVRKEVTPPQRHTLTGLGRDDPAEDAAEEEDPWRINVAIPPVPYGEGQYEVRIGNESGKINLNGANESILNMMLNGFGLEEQQKTIIVDSILDWRDENDLHRLNGAENDYYQSLPEPYNCKNDDFDSVEELLMVRGVTPEIFYGGLKDVVTAFKPDQKNSRGGDALSRVKLDVGKININAAPKKLLLALPSMTEALVEEIMEYRKTLDFTSLSQLSSIVGTDIYAVISPYITLESSPYFTVRSLGKIQEKGVRQGMEALVEINRKLKRGYRIVQWRDGFQDQE